MKIHKKIGIGLGLMVGFLFIFYLLFANSPTASAYTLLEVQNATFAFKDPKTITMSIRKPGVTDKYDFDTDGTISPFPLPHLLFGLSSTNSPQYECPSGPPLTGLAPAFTSIKILKTDLDSLATTSRQIPAEVTISYKQGTNCVNDGNVLSRSVAIPAGITVVGSGATSAGSVTGTDDACYQSGWALSWLFCPIITAAQTAANAMYGFVEDQLKFTVLQNCSTPSCADSLGQQHNSVHSAWNNFRILVSGLVVILLLVMVISQAIGAGPFDAYTVRKMLPRLVMGVILIQISWPVFSWVVNTVDHLGIGLADIMYAPFGGAKALDLNTIMGPFGAEAITFNIVGIGALAILGIAAPFIVVALLLTVLVALFVGFLTLLFRKILIILALIFVPVALIAWMMPNDGLRKYWKLWWDNFIKALMMFPLIIALIAAGRIFAKIGSGQSDFVGFFIVLVGFFGPLFILPKTFKWGGTLMQTAGQGIASVGQKGLKKPKEFLGERQKSYSAERKRQSQERYKNEEGFNVRRPWRRPIDLLRSGQWDPTRFGGHGRIREQAMIGYTAAGAESEQKDIEAANRATQLAIERIHPDEQDAYARALAAGQKLKIDAKGRIVGARRDEFDSLAEDAIDSKTGRFKLDDPRDASKASLLEIRSGLDQITRLGGEANIGYVQAAFERAMNSDDTAQIEMMNKFTTANVQSLFAKLPHMYKNNNYAVEGRPEQFDVARTVAGLNPNDVTALSGVGMRTLRDNLMIAAKGNADEIERDASGNAVLDSEGNTILTRQAKKVRNAREGLVKLASVFQQTAADPTLRGRIPSEVAKAMQELSTGRIRTSNNEVLDVDPDLGIKPILDDIASRIDNQGVVREPAPPPATPPPPGP